MKILIISRHVLPTQSPRAFRTTELAKEFVRQGHQVTVYALLGDNNYSTYEKETGVRFRNLGQSICGNADSFGFYKKSFINSVITKLFGHLIYYPSIELAWMTKCVIEREWRNYDLLITIAFPHSIHWGAAWVKSKNKTFIKWISDCGDPLMGDSMNKKLPFYFKKIEHFWGQQTNFITIPIETARNAYEEIVQDKIAVIPQGFDFSNIKLSKYKPNKIPTFCFAGSIYINKRDPKDFLDFLLKYKDDFKFIIYTNNINYFENYKKNFKEKLEVYKFISRDELLIKLSEMDFLINIKNESEVQSPSKLIDYSLSKRPILDIGTVFKEEKQFKEFIKGNYKAKHEDICLENYDIINVVKKFLSL